MLEEQPQETRGDSTVPAAAERHGLAGRWSRLLERYEAELGQQQDRNQRLRLLLAAARLLEEKLGRPEEALPRLEEALRLDAGFSPARRALKRLHREAGRLELLAGQLAAEVQAVSGSLKRAQLHWERGQTFDALGDEPSARQAYTDALAEAPGFLPALYALEPLLARAGEWTELARRLEQVIPRCSEPADQAALLTALGRLREEQLDDPEGSFEAYALAVDVFPQEVEALAALERLCRRLGRWADLARVLEKEAALSEGGPSGAATMLEVARIRLDLLADPAAARLALEEAVALDPLHRPSLEALASLLGAPADRPLLAEVLGRWAGVESEPRERADLLTRQGLLLLELGEEEQAVAALEEAVHSHSTHLPALQALGECYRRRGSWRSLARLQLEEGRSQADPELKARALLRAAEILERQLGDSEAALAALHEALATGPGRLAALRELSRLLGRLGRWAELAQVLAREAERATDPEQSVLHLLELSRVSEERLDDLDGAVQVLEAVLRLEPGHLPALERLAPLYRRQERWAELVATLLEAAEQLGDPRAVVALLADAARTAEEGLGDAER
ncbi:MAG: tetratricopeptide repeat protein, partial [Deltaproteobacteria bacterium]|nr:tetratricopeptide repeat protein [Deltaproteobacteria bacterium]